MSLDEDGKLDFDIFANSLEATVSDTGVVFEYLQLGGYATLFPIFTAFGLGLYVPMKITGKKKFHRKGEEHGSARWANQKEIKSLLDKPPKPKKEDKKTNKQDSQTETEVIEKPPDSETESVTEIIEDAVSTDDAPEIKVVSDDTEISDTVGDDISSAENTRVDVTADSSDAENPALPCNTEVAETADTNITEAVQPEAPVADETAPEKPLKKFFRTIGAPIIAIIAICKAYREKKKMFVKDNNIILTNEVKMSLNTRQTRKNLNVMVIGGSGSGKSRFYVKPNLMQANTSYVCTDPKGELLRSTGKMLEKYGYKIKVFNLIDMTHSNNYNPFNYIYDVNGNYSTTAVIKMINVLMKNTQKEGGGSSDQFWDDSTKALLAALCFYLVECEDKDKQNFSEVMKLLKKAEVKEGSDDFQSDLDLIFDALEHPENYRQVVEENEKMKELHLIDLANRAKRPSEYMCIKYYKDFKKAAGVV